MFHYIVIGLCFGGIGLSDCKQYRIGLLKKLLTDFDFLELWVGYIPERSDYILGPTAPIIYRIVNM